MTSASALADFIAGLMDLAPSEKQEVLETIDLRVRIDKVLRLLASRLAVLRLSREIGEQTQERLEERQREVLLREQLKTIQKQLGESEGGSTEIAELAEQITKANMPEEVEKQARKELKRLQHMSEMSAEYSMLRTYFDWLIEMPWATTTEEHIETAEARRIPDEDPYGL